LLPGESPSVKSSQRLFSFARFNRVMQGGPEGNERLTSASGAVLFLLLAAEGVTILSIRPLLSPHVFIGMLLIPPVALKLGSTGWRFARYYTGVREYRAKGPPILPLRMLAPVVVVSTLAVFGTGVALLALGPSARGLVLTLHKASFVVWLAATGIHVLAYLARLPRGLGDWRPGASGVSGAGGRRLLVSGTLVAGAILAVATVQYAAPWIHHG